MKLKGLIDYDISNYYIPSMFLIFPYCTFKCDKECGQQVCQNSALAREPIIETSPLEIIERYINNPLTHAIVCGGMEPFDSKDDLFSFVTLFRGFSKDTIVIYTGYTEEELKDEIPLLHQFDNIIIKFGRFIPNTPHIFDAILGVELASNNQHAVWYSRSVDNEYSVVDSRKNFQQEQKSD